MFQKEVKEARKFEEADFRKEMGEITEDESAFLNRVKAFEMLQNKRLVTFAQAKLILTEYREMKAEAMNYGVPLDILAARYNLVRNMKNEKAREEQKELTNA